MIVGMLALSLGTLGNVSAEYVSSSEVQQVSNNTTAVDESSKINGRETYGLSTEPSVIESLKNRNYFSERYGIYLSPDEEAKLEERFKIQDKVIPELKKDVLAAFGSDAYLGMYIDQKNGGIVNIGIREGGTSVKSESLIASKFSSEFPIKFYEAKYSESDLDRIMDLINTNVDSLSKQLIVYIAM
jgi:hypothetical protein